VPVSPSDVDEYVTSPEGDAEPGTVPALYAVFLTVLLAWLASELAPPLPGAFDVWRRSLDPLRARRRVSDGLQDLGPRVQRVAENAFRSLTASARASAARDLKRAIPGTLPAAEPRATALRSALRSCEERLASALYDTYLEAVTVISRSTGDPTREIQAVLDRAAARGLTVFVDTSGRRWSLTTWAETTVRAHYAQAALDEYTDACRSAGVSLVVVGRSASPCARCVPWENAILSLDDVSPGSVETSGRTVRVAGTLREARDAGLMHPWCRHRLVAWIPGRTTRLRSPRTVSAQARAWRRYTGRTARAWERRETVALTATARSRAASRASTWRSRKKAP
jgi:hypothetical protein